MTVFEFEQYLKIQKKMFREALNLGGNDPWNYMDLIQEIYAPLITISEYEVMTENLKEVVDERMDAIKTFLFRRKEEEELCRL